MNVTQIPWPPAYTVKRHRSAKYVKLRMHTQSGLLITVPYRFNLRTLPEVLERNKSWIIKQLADYHPRDITKLPDSIYLHATNENWRIHYMQCRKKLELILRPGNEVILVGNVEDQPVQCQKLLLKWIKYYAKNYLSQQLETISKQINLSFEKITVRAQQTLWGSCTANKSISLNYRLIFLPASLIRYVIIHELCHTIYLDHSDNFWKLVERFDPNYKNHYRELKKANKFIPGWT